MAPAKQRRLALARALLDAGLIVETRPGRYRDKVSARGATELIKIVAALPIDWSSGPGRIWAATTWPTIARSDRTTVRLWCRWLVLGSTTRRIRPDHRHLARLTRLLSAVG